MTAQVYDFRSFQTVRNSVLKAGLNPSPLLAKLRTAQNRGEPAMPIVNEAQRLRRMFRDELDPKGAA